MNDDQYVHSMDFHLVAYFILCVTSFTSINLICNLKFSFCLFVDIVNNIGNIR